MATWPATLPQSPLLEGYGDVPQDNVIRSDMDGRTKQRLRFTANLSDVSERYALTKQQFDTFKSFYENDIKFGAVEFIKPDPVNGGTSTYQIVEPYSFTVSGPIYFISISMERLP